MFITRKLKALALLFTVAGISSCGANLLQLENTNFETDTYIVSNSDPNFQTYFSNTYDGDPDVAKNFPDNPDKKFIKMVNDTKKTLDICIFEIDSKDITEAIINAHKRGVKVRMVVDSQSNDKFDSVKKLRAAKVSVVDDGGRSAFMHNKFTIADSKWVWTGSYNLTNNASWKHNDNVVKINSKQIAENYTIEFEEMYLNKKFGAKSPENIKYRAVSVGDKTVTTLFAPEDNVIGEIIKEVSKAKKSIKFMGFSFTDEELAKKLVKQEKNGVEISGIFENLGSKNDSSVLKNLAKDHKIKLYVKKPLQAQALMHHKVFIIDNKVTITGSFNFSQSASIENDENIIIINNREIAHDYSREFEKVKNRSYSN